jgi:hypothetical protein
MALGRVADEEFELCPDCGEKQLLPESANALMRICLGCGAVRKPDSQAPAAPLHRLPSLG